MCYTELCISPACRDLRSLTRRLPRLVVLGGLCRIAPPLQLFFLVCSYVSLPTIVSKTTLLAAFRCTLRCVVLQLLYSPRPFVSNRAYVNGRPSLPRYSRRGLRICNFVFGWCVPRSATVRPARAAVVTILDAFVVLYAAILDHPQIDAA